MLAMTLGLGLAPRAAMAGFVGTLDSGVAKAQDLEKVRQILETKKVSQTLASLGYDQEEIGERLASLSPQELSDLAGQLDEAMIPAGDGTVGIIIGVVLVILVVLGILSVMGKRVVVSE
jgi:hypothetical protein